MKKRLDALSPVDSVNMQEKENLLQKLDTVSRPQHGRNWQACDENS